MASIKIHRDIFNYERKRKGFTARQITGIVTGVAVCAAVTAFLGIIVEIPFFFAIDVGLLLAAPCVVAGFLPLFGMPAEEAAMRLLEGCRRGGVLLLDIEAGSHEKSKAKGVTSRAHRKSTKAKGYECERASQADSQDAHDASQGAAV